MQIAVHSRGKADGPRAGAGCSTDLTGCNALQVVQALVERHSLHDAILTFVSHPATQSWRQRHPTVDERIENLRSQPAEQSGHPVRGRQLLGLDVDDLDAYRERSDHVVSISSRIEWADGSRQHLALMDLCPEEFIPLDRLQTAVRRISDERYV